MSYMTDQAKALHISTIVGEAAQAAKKLSAEDVAAWRAAAAAERRRNDTLGPLLDPTAYKRTHRAIDAVDAVAAAYAAFHTAVLENLNPEGARP